MKLVRNLLGAAVVACFAIQTCARAIGGTPKLWIKDSTQKPLQDIVTWDENSLFVRGERIFLFSGEFHPFRLPVPSLYLDVFQKIKALGFNGVSFYIDWALLEGKPGEFSAEGVFSLEPFFEAATKAGIYLLARPGPYINAEVSGGGFPGWLQRVNGTLRTRDPGYLHTTDLYAKSVGEIIAKAQITNGGPIILVQPENEYTGATSDIQPFPDPVYMQYVEDQLRKVGIIVPLISNDAGPEGHNAPGQSAAVDIYGHDGYPLGFDCAHPYTWPDGKLPTTWRALHLQQSPNTPYSIVEFQGGSFDPWGGLGFDQCSVLLNHEFERVFYKNDYSFGVTIFNIYMIFGGTNWGNLGHPGGYTSYDYGSVITEERLVTREKYSELKLEANFFKVSPAYLVAERGDASNSTWTSSTALTVTPAFANSTAFYFVRHAAYSSLDSTSYKLNVQTSQGNFSVPQLGGSLTLNGRDSKIHVSDYDVGGLNILYSTAEVFTWKKYASKTVLAVYGGPGETHEIAVQASDATLVEGSGPTISKKKGYTIVNWKASSDRKIVKVNSDVFIYLLDRNSAYNYWVVDQAPHDASTSVIVNAGYLVRSATVKGNTLALVGDFNATTAIEVIGGAPKSLSKLTINGKSTPFKKNNLGVYTTTLIFEKPQISIPDLSKLKWKYLDSLPELQSTYSDASWTSADLKTTYNTLRPLTTPTSLYSSDYGYHTGTLLYRGHFTATGAEQTVFLWTQGGSAFGMSAFLNSTFLGSWAGIDAATNANTTFTLPNLVAGHPYVLTVVIDNMGLDEDWTVGTESMKNPRGILNYALSGREQSAVAWKLTGNLGGEDYADRSRGPLNEGGTFAERQGFHLPSAPIKTWEDSAGPTAGIAAAGIGLFATTVELDLPVGYDIPLSFTFTNASVDASGLATAYRAQLFVNGWQYGKYVHNVGPQTRFPVPEGVLDYKGRNYVAVSLWALEEGGAKVEGLELVVDAVVQTGYGEVETVEGDVWTKRKGAY
ncbi:hypothetical protein BU16DRAFT_560944 [Lophium mytilinum]|uniref:Beta-galactosidase n=1 Tax=Lophium mytilinum TaxID=390894 RepID=A0A6A6QUM3_9PEZI|nr:hypothetical protein BU16DRAFT_560944 [Lophium mytilinum]